MAKASGRPVAVTCTSGTAAANLLPAVVEAREARVPLIVLTADRPPELRDVGAGQAIDQLKLYGSRREVVRGGRQPRARRARPPCTTARSPAAPGAPPSAGGPGPVHLNFPLREPLAPVPEELDAGDWAGPRRTAGPGPSCATAPTRPTPTTCRRWRSGWRRAPRGA